MPTRRSLLRLLAASPALALLTRPAHAMEPETFAENGIAIRGTDPVGYFREGRPVPGDPAHQLMWKDAIWTFASAETMTEFEMNPEAYAPQFGGYCAFAMAQGALAPTDPAAFTIHEGKLYLNYSLGVRDRWSEDIPGNIAKAEGYWPDILWT